MINAMKIDKGNKSLKFLKKKNDMLRQMDLFGYIVEETIMVGYQGVTHLNKYKNIMQFI